MNLFHPGRTSINMMPCETFIQYPKTEKLQRFLIEKVKQHEILYHKKLMDTTPSNLRVEAWNNVSQALNISAEDAEKTWNYLKKCYVSAQTPGLDSTLPWWFEKQMEFLIPHIESENPQSEEEGPNVTPAEEVFSEIERDSKGHSSEESNRRSSTDEGDIILRIDENSDENDNDDIIEILPKKKLPNSSRLRREDAEKLEEEEGVARIKEWVNQASTSTFVPESEDLSILPVEDLPAIKEEGLPTIKEEGLSTIKEEDVSVIEEDDNISILKMGDSLKRRERDIEDMRRRYEAELKAKLRRSQSSNRSDRNLKRGWRERYAELRSLGRRQKVALQKQMIEERMRHLQKQVKVVERQRRQLDRLSMSDWDNRSVSSSVLDRQLFPDDNDSFHERGSSSSISSYDSAEWELASVPESSVAESESVVRTRDRTSRRRSVRPMERKHMTAVGHFDEEDIFYLSMARMCSKFAPADQAVLKYKLTNFMLELAQEAKDEEDAAAAAATAATAGAAATATSAATAAVAD